jgi:uncharacterized membrane protein
LKVGAKVLISLTGLVSSPSYLALLMLVFRRVAMILIPYRDFLWLGGWAYILEFLGLLAEPVALVIAISVSFFAVRTREKGIVRIIATGGILTWLLAAWMLPRNLW